MRCWCALKGSCSEYTLLSASLKPHTTPLLRLETHHDRSTTAAYMEGCHNQMQSTRQNWKITRIRTARSGVPLSLDLLQCTRAAKVHW